jgi:SAM-dependent methyltransferase
MTGPRIGDAFGNMLLECTRRAGVPEIIERSDGFIVVRDPARYFAPPQSWQQFEREALALAGGSVLDVGCGAGRFALALRERGTEVTALDVSAGAVLVTRERGVQDVVHGDIHAVEGSYDTFLLMGENLGLLESAAKAGGFLGALAAHARPGARIIGHGADPGAAIQCTMPTGETTIRVRHRDLATEWFGYLVCSPAELGSLAEPAGWELTSADYADKVNYLAVLTLARLLPSRSPDCPRITTPSGNRPPSARRTGRTAGRRTGCPG